MKQWQKIGIAVGALVLAIAAGTGAYAMRGDDDGGSENTTRDTEQDAGDKRSADPNNVGDVIGGEGGGLAAICVEGTVDCQDTDLGDPMDQPCPEGGCTAENGGGTQLSGLPACADDVAPEECAAYKCVTMESNPPQTKCYWASCDVPTEAPVVGEDPAVSEAPELVDPVPFDIVDEPASDGIPAEEAERLRAQESVDEPEIVPCGPSEDCTSGDIQGARCLPPDCAVSSDGSVACPDELIDPPADGQGQTEPGGAGSGGGVDPSPPVQVDPVE